MFASLASRERMLNAGGSTGLNKTRPTARWWSLATASGLCKLTLRVQISSLLTNPTINRFVIWGNRQKFSLQQQACCLMLIAVGPRLRGSNNTSRVNNLQDIYRQTFSNTIKKHPIYKKGAYSHCHVNNIFEVITFGCDIQTLSPSINGVFQIRVTFCILSKYQYLIILISITVNTK